jgi:hypothetical protein
MSKKKKARKKKKRYNPQSILKGCIGKVKYKSKAGAEVSAIKQNRGKLYSYHCFYCGGFHLTSNKSVNQFISHLSFDGMTKKEIRMKIDYDLLLEENKKLKQKLKKIYINMMYGFT